MEYLLSRQLDEAAACVKELDCKLFHHEIIKRGVKVKGMGSLSKASFLPEPVDA